MTFGIEQLHGVDAGEPVIFVVQSPALTACVLLRRFPSGAVGHLAHRAHRQRVEVHDVRRNEMWRQRSSLDDVKVGNVQLRLDDA
jgi:hypothetical protein